MDWKMVDTDLLADAALNGIAEAAAELARREQAAQPEAQPTNDDLMRNNRELARLLNTAHDSWNVVYAESQRRGERIIELERENERLRGLLAQIIAIAEDALVMAKDRHAETSYARRIEAIEAAKEATK